MRTIIDLESEKLLVISKYALDLLIFDGESDDPAIIAEAVAINESFEWGFEMLNAVDIPDTDYVEILLRGFKPDTFGAEMYLEMFNGWTIEVKRTGPKTLKYRWYNTIVGTTDEGEADVRINGAGKEQFSTNGKNVFPLWTSKSTVWKKF